MDFGIYDMRFIGKFDKIPEDISIKGSLCRVKDKMYLYTDEEGWILVEAPLEILTRMNPKLYRQISRD